MVPVSDHGLQIGVTEAVTCPVCDGKKIEGQP